jgi:hypothetical protein
MVESADIHAFCSDRERYPTFVRAVGELAVSAEVELVRYTRGEAERYCETCEVAAFAQVAQREYRPCSRTWASFSGSMAGGRRVGVTLVVTDDGYGQPVSSRGAPLQLMVSRSAFARSTGARPRYQPWQEGAEALVVEREVLDDTLSLLASFGRAIGAAGTGVTTLAWEYAAPTSFAAFGARFRSPELMLQAYADGVALSEERLQALLRQDAARVRSSLAVLAVPDQQELELDAIVARARQLLQVSEQTDVVAIDWRARERLFPPAPRWQLVFEDDGAVSVACTPYSSLATFYDVLAELLLTT